MKIGFLISCASYLTQNAYSTVTVLYTWTFQVTAGYNQLLVNSVQVSQGNLIMLTQSSASIALDVSGTAALYSDLAWQSVVWSSLSANLNWRFYLNTLDDLYSYEFSLNLVHTYSSSGLFNAFIMYTNTNTTFQQIINVTQS